MDEISQVRDFGLQAVGIAERIARSVFFDMESRICVAYLPFTLVLAYVAYRRMGESRGPSFWLSVVISDFCSYWVHRLHHRVPLL